MNDYDLSTGTREIGGGLERYRFQMPASFFLSLARAGLDVKSRIVGVYCLSPRPDPREIVDVKVKIAGKKADVELVIQRGHYHLARLVHEHDGLFFDKKAGYATCQCCPGRVHPLVAMSIPNYGEEL